MDTALRDVALTQMSPSVSARQLLYFLFFCLVHSDVAESRPCAVVVRRLGSAGLPLTAALLAVRAPHSVKGAAAAVQRALTPAVALCDTGSFLRPDLHLQMSAQAGVV